MIRKITTSVLLFATLVLLVSQFQLIIPTTPILNTQNMFLQMADVIGVSVGVPPNPYNTLAAQLDQKQATLAAQQEQLNQQAATLKSEQGQANALDTNGKNILIAGILIDAFLLIINLFMEMKKNDHPQTATYQST